MHTQDRLSSYPTSRRFQNRFSECARTVLRSSRTSIVNVGVLQGAGRLSIHHRELRWMRTLHATLSAVLRCDKAVSKSQPNQVRLRNSLIHLFTYNACMTHMTKLGPHKYWFRAHARTDRIRFSSSRRKKHSHDRLDSTVTRQPNLSLVRHTPSILYEVCFCFTPT